jgi:hypothetical protein
LDVPQSTAIHAAEDLSSDCDTATLPSNVMICLNSSYYLQQGRSICVCTDDRLNGGIIAPDHCTQSLRQITEQEAPDATASFALR